MPIWFIVSLRKTTEVISDKLSLNLLVETFFVPWHRDNSALGKVIGVVMRLIAIPIALFVDLTVIVGYIAFILLWLALPIMTIFFIISTLFIKN